MSRTAQCGAVITIVAGGLLTSCAHPARSSVEPFTLVAAKFPITIDFKCNSGVNQIGLTDGANQAWSVSASKGQAIKWRVPGNVTINSITPKTGGTLPVTPGASHGGSGGADYDATVDNVPGNNVHYAYKIDVTCTPLVGGGGPVRLVIDPDMIIL